VTEWLRDVQPGLVALKIAVHAAETQAVRAEVRVVPDADRVPVDDDVNLVVRGDGDGFHAGDANTDFCRHQMASVIA
jgi:hypothetical protein